MKLYIDENGKKGILSEVSSENGTDWNLTKTFYFIPDRYDVETGEIDLSKAYESPSSCRSVSGFPKVDDVLEEDSSFKCTGKITISKNSEDVDDLKTQAYVVKAEYSTNTTSNFSPLQINNNNSVDMNGDKITNTTAPWFLPAKFSVSWTSEQIPFKNSWGYGIDDKNDPLNADIFYSTEGKADIPVMNTAKCRFNLTTLKWIKNITITYNINHHDLAKFQSIFNGGPITNELSTMILGETVPPYCGLLKPPTATPKSWKNGDGDEVAYYEIQLMASIDRTGFIRNVNNVGTLALFRKSNGSLTTSPEMIYKTCSFSKAATSGTVTFIEGFMRFEDAVAKKVKAESDPTKDLQFAYSALSEPVPLDEDGTIMSAIITQPEYWWHLYFLEYNSVDWSTLDLPKNLPWGW